MSATTAAGGGSGLSIETFSISIDQRELDDLRSRLEATRWPQRGPGEQGWDRGVPLDYLQGLSRRWARDFDWRAQEERLNAFRQYTTVIDGQRIHFLHVQSPERDALPLILLHSWPGSVAEFVRLVGPLTESRAHGDDSRLPFHVVVPSLPGFGFSVPVAEAGWTTGRAARALVELMRQLGYERYGVHGGDIGAGVGTGMGSTDPDGVVAIHVTTDLQTAVTVSAWSGDLAQNPALSSAQKEQVERLKARSRDDEGYLRIQSTRPQTIGYALADSPVGQLAWIVEKFNAWTDQAASLPEDAVDMDQLLANVSIYWFTRSGSSAAHALYESMHAQEWSEPGPAPTGFAVFGADPIVRLLLDPDHRLQHWSEFERGGHFPAMEQPDLLVEDIRSFFQSYR
jgi:pimeloyl-ACP methyl ester carboxylesterase